MSLKGKLLDTKASLSVHMRIALGCNMIFYHTLRGLKGKSA